MRRVVITGVGVVTPLGNNLEVLWDNLLVGKSGIDKITQFDPSCFDSQIAGEVKDFHPPSFLSSKDLRRISRFVQFALYATEQAIKDSHLTLEKIDPYRVGVVIGSGIGSLQSVEREHSIFLEKGPRKISPFLIPMLITNEAAGIVSINFGIKGINFCTVTACASGAHAIGEAYRVIQRGDAEIMVAGGTEACITSMGVGGFCALKALSKRNDAPQRASRPFDKERDGFVIAEGCGIVILEELGYAKRRRANIYGEILGYGATADAYHITAPDPQAEAAAKAVERAFKEARINPEEKKIYINAHGTSTPLNDKVETIAIKKALGNIAKNVHISSTKSMLGHSLGAAGAIEFIICCLALKNKKIPPTINLDNPDPECDLDYTPNQAREVDIDIAASNSLGFGGHNVVLIVEEFK